MTSFVLWLREQQNRRDDVGDVTRTVARDTCLARLDYEGVRLHLEHEHHATKAALSTLEQAAAEHRRALLN